jgi:hypothetical protein
MRRQAVAPGLTPGASDSSCIMAYTVTSVLQTPSQESGAIGILPGLGTSPIHSLTVGRGQVCRYAHMSMHSRTHTDLHNPGVCVLERGFQVWELQSCQQGLDTDHLSVLSRLSFGTLRKHERRAMRHPKIFHYLSPNLTP